MRKKAFDSVRRSFLYKVLGKFGFHKGNINIIFGLYKKTVARIKIIGELPD